MIQKKMVRATDIVRILPVNSEIENYKGYYYDYGLFVIWVSIGQVYSMKFKLFSRATMPAQDFGSCRMAQ